MRSALDFSGTLDVYCSGFGKNSIFAHSFWGARLSYRIEKVIIK